MPRGLSKLFRVGQQSTNRDKNNGVIGLTNLHWGFMMHSSHRYLWRSEELLVQMKRFYFLLWASLLLHLVLVL